MNLTRKQYNNPSTNYLRINELFHDIDFENSINELDNFNIGDMVYHVRFGLGKIIDIIDDKAFFVDFKNHGSKKLVKNSSELKKL